MRKILLALLMLLMVPVALSVGVSPPAKEYIFEPGIEGEIQFYFRNNLEKPTTLIASLGGELADYATISSEKEMYLNPQEKGYVDVSFSLPEHIGEPGWHSFNVIATEASGSGGTVGARGEVKVPISFFVLYPGKKLSIKLDAADAGVGQNVSLRLNVFNVGTEPVEQASAKIEILKDSKKIGEVSSEPFAVEVMESKNIDIYWNSEGAAQGVYLANAAVAYSLGEEYANDTFRIGTFDIDVTNHTKKVGRNAVNKFFVEVESKWNQKIENIFADINVLKNGNSVASFSAAEQSLEPWQKKRINGFLDAEGLEKGGYNISINVRFSSQGETKTKVFGGSIEVVDKEEAETAAEAAMPVEESRGNWISGYFTTTNILMLLVVLLVIINLAILVKRRKNEKQEK